MTGLATYVGLADHGERTMADSLRVVADGHADDAEVLHTARTLAGLSDRNRERLAPVVERYGEEPAPDEEVDEPERLRAAGLAEVRGGPLGLLRDLQDLHVLGGLVRTTWTVIGQAAQAERDRELLEVAVACGGTTDRQLRWLLTHLKTVAPTTLVRS